MNGYLGGRAKEWLSLSDAIGGLLAEHDPQHEDVWRVGVAADGSINIVHVAPEHDVHFRVALL